MTIQQVYEQYRIMPNLQLHQLRVTSVAKMIVDGYVAANLPVQETEVLKTMLLHDMGNILKFDLMKFPEFLKPEGKEYWQSVQREFREKYGDDEHQASVKIAEELGLSERVQFLIESVGFTHSKTFLSKDDTEAWICEYADLRVTPFGVVSLQQRLQDLEDRYAHKYPSEADKQRREQYKLLAIELEQRLFAPIALKPADITDVSIQPVMEKLKLFEL